MQQKLLYGLAVVLSSVLVLIALGGGLFGQSEPWFLQLQHKLFADLCHQEPARSFWLNGQPMAVCSRCFGIYSGFFVGLITILFLEKKLKQLNTKKILLVTLILNIVDVAGNLLGFWQNTLISRSIAGFLLGTTAALVLGQAFIKPYHLTLNITNYGTTKSNK